ncbi:MAG: biotin--[acetyl-CoA-carboxylase] ligase [Dehalococcoidia bacterium]|nr:biotin--[acetyl-CoA-carboxylase] ligase [Dehalococcoidia bacterium]
MSEAFSLAALQAKLTTEFIGRTAVYQERIGSTMDVAHEEAEGGAPDGMIVVADEQTHGKGRGGRSWVSPPRSNVYVTVVLRPDAATARSLAMTVALAICEAADAVAGTRSAIKWPNDVLIGGRKVAGVLIDLRFAGDELDYALLGVGINVNFDPERYEEIAASATSLKRETGREVSREAVLATFLERLESLYVAARRGESAAGSWKERLETLGRRVTVRIGDRVEEGMAEDVDANGNLLLRRPDGSVIPLAAGDVTLEA